MIADDVDSLAGLTNLAPLQVVDGLRARTVAVVAGALDGRQHVLGILHEVDVADDGTTHGAFCRALTVPRQTEDGLADTKAGTVKSAIRTAL